jgi:hypothetical protein
MEKKPEMKVKATSNSTFVPFPEGTSRVFPKATRRSICTWEVQTLCSWKSGSRHDYLAILRKRQFHRMTKQSTEADTPRAEARRADNTPVTLLGGEGAVSFQQA